MQKKSIFFITIIFLGIVGMLAYYFINPYLEEQDWIKGTDANQTKTTLHIGVDNWIGYYPLCSRELKRRMRESGYLIQCQDDQADYGQRMNQLKNKKLEFAVATVDAYLLNGHRQKFPGTMVMVIDESKGGDALVAYEDKLKSLDDLKQLQTPIKIAFTPASPSEFLLRSIGVHFDIPFLKDKTGAWRVETDGSKQALDKLKSKEVDAAVLWEPNVSQALQITGTKKLLSTKETEKLIVDVLLVNREYAQEHPEAVQILLANYFRALKVYRDYPERFEEELKDELKVSTQEIKAMLAGVKWMTLTENALHWFGIPAEGQLPREDLIDVIESSAQTLKEVGEFSQNPIPDGNAYLLQNRNYIKELFTQGLSREELPQSGQADSLKGEFKSLSAYDWDQLNQVGTLKIRPIQFQSGTNDLSDLGQQALDKAVDNLKHYPYFRVLIKGHTGLRGDPEANKELSQTRADAVKQFMIQKYGIHENRLRAVGYGSAQPLRRNPDESNRSYQYRLPRVELFLVSEVY